MSRKILYFLTHPVQYQLPLILELQKICDLSVVYSRIDEASSFYDPEFGRNIAWNVPLLEGYHYEVLTPHLAGWVPKGILSYLREAKRRSTDGLEVILHGYNYKQFLTVILLARILRIPVGVRSDVRFQDESSTGSRLRSWLKQSFLKYLLFPRISTFYAVGGLNSEYFLAHNVSESSIVSCGFPVDNTAFTAGKVLEDMRNVWRGHEKGRFIWMVSGKLIERKKVHDVVSVVKQNSDYALVICGDGPESSALRAQSGAETDEQIFFLGFKDQKELPDIYASVDGLIIPAENERWGLVVNEAIAAGKVVVASSDVGAARDLVREERIFAVKDITQMENRMRSLVKSNCDLQFETFALRAHEPSSTAAAIVERRDSRDIKPVKSAQGRTT